MSDRVLEQHLSTITKAGESGAVAFFDLDGTLIAGYSILALALETARAGLGRGELRQSVKMIRDTLGQRRRESGGNYHRLVRCLSRALAGISEDSLRRLGEQACQRHLARSLYREAISLVEAHRAAGHKLVIVTAASHYQVEPIARLLGIEEICCTRLEVLEGRFTGKVISPMCYGEGKALAARRVARREHTGLEQCWFYTDSSADLPLLKVVGHPVAVNPSDSLGAHARSQRWPQLHFASRGLPDIESLLRTTLTGQAVTATALVGAIGKRLGLPRFANANRVTQLLGDLGSGFAGLEFDIEGAEHLQQRRPAIFVFNHQSMLDAMVLAHLLRRDVVPFCKQEMSGVPVLGPLLQQVGTIFVDRQAQNQSAVLQEAQAVLASGRSLVIAPEGTRSTLGHIQPFKHGAFFLARKAGVPIVPIVLHNVKDALPKGGFLIRPATIRVSVLPPLEPSAMGSVRDVCSSLEARYSSLLGVSRVAALPHQTPAVA
ncbi:HAD-IB family hydrolase [Haliea sp. E1-2-M8]|uniref:HAD-IB family hydrolase n=1 Tax=Haliea sp. E1-2-M8 TaxID=3064706 RepID=UPI002718055C|nr:HAD-IB family hydrolase [Haliea sp. E1-2-M8]MDO8860863.1 HAD-IB family hydrolase [Haliea sp. E1-2-M8]